MTVNFKGAAKRIEDIDLPRIGALIGVGEDEIHAVIEVEASGSGFDSQGRLKALYEPHIAYREASKLKDKSILNRFINEGLAYPSWRKDYPSDSYPRILKALAINEDVALKSTSWGLGQIMGFNHKSAGYLTVQSMIADFIDDEDNHLEAMIGFIIINKLDDNIRAHDWNGFALGYNGEGYKNNNYHIKLANAYLKWSKIKDTPYPDVIKVEDLPKSPVLIPSISDISVSKDIDIPAPIKPQSVWARFWAALATRLHK